MTRSFLFVCLFFIPAENQVLMKWGEYSSDVHFILQRTALDSPSGGSTPSANNKNNAFVSPGNNKNVPSRPTKTSVDPLHGFTPPAGLSSSSSSSSPSKDLKKSLTFSGGRPAPTDSPQPGGGGGGGGGERKLNVGVVRGIPQQPHQVNDNYPFFLTILLPPPFLQDVG